MTKKAEIIKDEQEMVTAKEKRRQIVIIKRQQKRWSSPFSFFVSFAAKNEEKTEEESRIYTWNCTLCKCRLSATPFFMFTVVVVFIFLSSNFTF